MILYTMSYNNRTVTSSSRYIPYGLHSLIIWPFLCMIAAVPLPYQSSVNEDPGEPLFLTPLITDQRLDEARNKSKVVPFVGEIESYSGYLTVNETYHSNLFFWFFIKDPQAPIILWLQGGPGASSMAGLLFENGPYVVDTKLDVTLRKYAWTNFSSILYIDNPVGAGFSFTEDAKGYARNETDVGQNLYAALLQLFTLFPNLRNNNFFIAGESYAGKYIPAIAYTIHLNNPSAKLKINLQGLAIGNGFCDPEHMLAYGDYLYQLGLIDGNGKEQFHALENKTLRAIKDQKWLDAYNDIETLISANENSLFENLTGLTGYYDYLMKGGDTPPPTDHPIRFIELNKVKKTIHAGNLTFNNGGGGRSVEFYLREDIMKSVANWVEVLIENYRLLIFNGQLDVIVAYPLTVGFLNNLNWSGADSYKTANRTFWKVDGTIAGYAKTVKNFTEILVRNAGHVISTDQPLVAYEMIKRFVFNKGF